MPSMHHCARLLLPLLASLGAAAALHAEPLATASVRVARGESVSAYDGVVQAVRETAVAAKVSGAIVSIAVHAGDRVASGQPLLSIDAREADQLAAASAAQVEAGKALLEAATREYERQRALFDRQFIGRSALDQAEAQFRSSRAQANAQIAAAAASRAQAGFYTITAPYDAVISDVPAMPGDMAMPGRTLLSLYDPARLRVSANLPQGVAAQLGGVAPDALRIELPGLTGAQRILPAQQLTILPRVDPATHTVEIRLALAAGADPAPGQFARIWLPVADDGAIAGATRLYIPATCLVRHAGMTGVYVVDSGGKPQLRQLRLGHPLGDEVEVLSGLDAGERVARDPDAAAAIQ